MVFLRWLRQADLLGRVGEGTCRGFVERGQCGVERHVAGGKFKGKRRGSVGEWTTQNRSRALQSISVMVGGAHVVTPAVRAVAGAGSAWLYLTVSQSFAFGRLFRALTRLCL